MQKDEILEKYFGFSSLKKEQNEIIDSVLDGNDTIGLLPTGFGKTICFIIPALIFDGITIVISPLISLMVDQVTNLKKNGIKAEYINSNLEPEEKKLIYEKIIKGKIKIIYIAAERLANHDFLNIIKKVDVSLIVADEAHTLLWSEDFRKGMKEITSFIDSFKIRPKIMALTATSTISTTKKIEEILDLKNPNVISFICDRENIFYNVVKAKNKDDYLLKFVRYKKEKILIYCLTIKMCVHVYNLLKDKYKVGIYHGKLERKDKDKCYKLYKENKINIVIATNAFGMGIDIPDIRYVIEYEMPSSIEDFSQQAGRASRDNKFAEAIILFNLGDIKKVEYFIDNIEDDDYKKLRKIKNERRNKLDSIVEFCLSKRCLHKHILNYFGFDGKNCMNMCINCSNKQEYK